MEILQALGFLLIYPENHAALCGARRKAVDLCAEAEHAGYSRDLCSYARTDIGAMISGKTPAGRLPRPDVLVCCTNICQTVLHWYRVLADYFGCPLILIDSGIFGANEAPARWIIDDWEDNLTMSEPLGLNVHVWVDEDLWFSRGGMVFQANLQNPIRSYLRRGEARAAIRGLYKLRHLLPLQQEKLPRRRQQFLPLQLDRWQVAIYPNGDHGDMDDDNDGDVDEDDLHPDKMSDEDKLYARGLGRKFMKYAKDGKEDDFLGGLDDDDKKSLRSYMKYMCDDKESKEKYAAKCGSCGGSTMDSGEMKPGEPERYGKPSVDVSPTKAKQILEDGEIRGKPLTKAARGDVWSRRRQCRQVFQTPTGT